MSQKHLQHTAMKDKISKGKGLPNKHLHARTTFLYQAATYLTLRSATVAEPAKGREVHKGTSAHSNLALQLASHLRAVSRKGQARLSAELKRSICKSCDAILIPGRTASHTIENESNNKGKPWADVLVIQCNICNSKKRFPIGLERQQSKTERALKGLQSGELPMEVDQATAISTCPYTVQNPVSG